MAGEAALHLAAGLIIAAPMLYAGASKLLDPSRFTDAIPRFGLAFLPSLPTSALLVGGIELAVGAALVVVPVTVTAAVAGLLYLAFALALLRARLRGSSGDCGCFGALAGAIDARSIARNIGLALASLGLAYVRNQVQFGRYELAPASALVVILTLAGAATDTVLAIRSQP